VEDTSLDPTPPRGALAPPVALATRLPTPTSNSLPAAGPSVVGVPDWTFSVVGDTWKDTPMLRYILHDAATSGDALLIDLGDLTPQGRPEQMADFDRLARSAGLPVYAVPGNHDVAWSKTTAPFEKYWPRHQSFDVRNAHFTLVDDSSETLDADELAWAEHDLAATGQPLRFVFMHVPPLMPYPVPSESSLQAGGPEFMALMEKYHVSEVYAGHLHAYFRIQPDGVPYVITGGGGEPLHVPSLLGGRYHYVRVTVRASGSEDSVIPLDNVPTPAP